MEPLVSILIPVYNAEGYVAETIGSALAQTWPNREIIVVDDGSTDNSLAVAKKLESKGVIVLQQPNQGASAARNRALKHAKGDFIQYLDADDLLSPDKIEAQVALLRSNPTRVAVCHTVHFLDGEDPLGKSPDPYEARFLLDADDPVEFLINLYGGNGEGASMVQPNAWLTPRGVIERAGPWNAFRCPDDDGEYFCRVLLASDGVRVSRNGLNYYRKFKHRRSLSAQKSYPAMENILLSYDLKKKHLLQRTSDIRARQALVTMYTAFAINNYPAHKNLTSRALATAEELGGAHYPYPIGGKLLTFIQKNLGWKTARVLSHYRNRLFG